MPHVGRPMSVLYRKHEVRPKGCVFPFLALNRHTSRVRCVKRLLTCNRFTSAMGACFPMVLPTHRMGLIILVDETLNISHPLGTRLPAVMRRRVTAPANEVVRSLPLHVAVAQDTLHVKALATARVHQRLWRRREDQVRLVCQTLSRTSRSTTACSTI